jgi:hypothetical protein
VLGEQNLVGELSAGLKSKFLGQNEGVVAVKEDGGGFLERSAFWVAKREDKGLSSQLTPILTL